MTPEPEHSRETPFPIHRYDLDEHTSVYLSGRPMAGAEARDERPAVSARAWRVRPGAVALGAVLASAALLRAGATAEGLLAAVVLGVLGVLTVIDLEHRLLPNRIVGPAIVAVLALQAAFFPSRLIECIIAALGGAAVLLIPGLLRRNSVGMGDVKLAGLLGAALGGKVLTALTLGSLATLPVALVILLRGSGGRTATIPLGPFLTIGTAATLLS